MNTLCYETGDKNCVLTDLCSIFYHLVFLIPGMKNLTHYVKLK